MHQLMETNPFATLITLGAEGFRANHIPMELDKEPSPFGSLRGHVARANSVWREVSPEAEALVIFQGPNAYISPSWYPSKMENGTVVPTWNYIVVHAHGRISVVDDAQWIERHIESLVQQQEAAFAHPWALADAPRDYTEKMLRGVVGIELVIGKLVGKWKASQNRRDADRAGVASGLRAVGASSMAEFVERGKESFG
jgi:transcriptional regulator